MERIPGVLDAGRRGGTLPISFSPIIGRDQEIAEITSLLVDPDVRLVVLTGPGGIGKTRLAAEVAHWCNRRFAHGSMFVSLAPVQDPAGVIPAVALEFSLHTSGVRPLPERLANEIADREMLLVLDNFEHIASAAPELIDLLTDCPGLTMLVTSRVVLRVTGEFDYPVSPLNWHQSGNASELPGAIQLFTDRARAIVPGFELDGRTFPVATEICGLLDGLPLGIELAAARLRHFPIDVLLKRLNSQLSILSNGPKNLPDRLQTMRNAIRWSYDLLEPNEQSLFRRLSVFPGGFRLDAAAWMHGQNDEDTVMDLLATLIDSSLVLLSSESGERHRYRILEPIRAFGLEQLECLDESNEQHRNMSDWYVDLAAQGRTSLNHRINDLHWLRRFDEEIDNLRGTLAWLESAEQADGMLKIAVSLGWYWYARALLRECCAWIDRSLTISATKQVDALLRGWALFWQGIMLESRGKSDRSHALMLAAREQFRQLEDHRCETLTIAHLGTFALQSGDHLQANTYLHEVLAFLQEDPDPDITLQAFVYFQLGNVSRASGNLDQATDRYQRALEISEANGDHWTKAAGLLGLGISSRERGEFSVAADQLKACLRECLTVGTIFSEAAMAGTGALASVMIASGDMASGTRLFGFEHHVRASIDTPRKYQARTMNQRYEALAKKRLGEEQFARTWREGEQLGVDEALELAWSFNPEVPVPVSEKVSLEDSEVRDQLTPRELEILELVAEGLTNPEIGERLFISRGTVRIHVSHILGKLGAGNRMEAVKQAQKRGILPLS